LKPLRNVALDQVVPLLLLCSGLVACSDATSQRYDSEFLAMGTQVQLSLWANSPAQAARVSRQLEQQLLQQGIEWYPWTDNPQGELRRLNKALAARQPFTLSQPLAELLYQSRQLHQTSQGYFDPVIAPLTVAWGFAGSTSPAVTTLPSATQLAEWRQSRPRFSDLQLHDRQVSSDRDPQLDLGAIAKGYALDLAMQRLEQQGITQASINLGGQVILMGKSLPTSLARVALRDPRSAQSLAEVQLHDGESISSSGDYQRNAMVQGRRIHHLLDPHTGEPVAHTQAVTVIASSATLADAASTALMAAGPQHWLTVARTMGISEALRIDATGKIEVTTALYARLHWNRQLASPPYIQQVAL
jgi:thiamine biosynthesis lipoprotein